jgi:hypothetical protein
MRIIPAGIVIKVSGFPRIQPLIALGLPDAVPLILFRMILGRIIPAGIIMRFRWG